MSTPPTGRPRGRPKGSKSKRTVARDRKLAEITSQAAVALGTDLFEGDAHALLVLTYKDIGQPLAVRLDAAKAAISFEKPRLAAIDQTLEGTLIQRVVSAEPMDEDEWAARYGNSLATPTGPAKSTH